MHDLHIWSLSQERLMAQVHVVISPKALPGPFTPSPSYSGSSESICSLEEEVARAFHLGPLQEQQTESPNSLLRSIGDCLRGFGVDHMTLQFEEASQAPESQAAKTTNCAEPAGIRLVRPETSEGRTSEGSQV